MDENSSPESPTVTASFGLDTTLLQIELQKIADVCEGIAAVIRKAYPVDKDNVILSAILTKLKGIEDNQ